MWAETHRSCRLSGYGVGVGSGLGGGFEGEQNLVTAVSRWVFLAGEMSRTTPEMRIPMEMKVATRTCASISCAQSNLATTHPASVLSRLVIEDKRVDEAIDVSFDQILRNCESIPEDGIACTRYQR